MTNSFTRRILAGLTVVAVSGATLAAGASGSQADIINGGWTGTWGAALVTPSTGGVSNRGFNNESVRMSVRTSVAGQAVRIRLGNPYGVQATQLGHATVALPKTDTPERYDVDPATIRELTFAGSKSANLYRGGDVLSDPVPLAVPALQELIVTLYLPSVTGSVSWHWQARQNSYIYAGDQTLNAEGTGFTLTTTSWYLLAGVDVLNTEAYGSVVVYGDSISDGFTSTFGANTRWPDYLAARIVNTTPSLLDPGVLNQAISGNQVVRESSIGANGKSAMARLDADVYGQTGVRSVIIQLGTNDALNDVPAAEIIEGLHQLGVQMKERGLRTVALTIVPFEGWLTWTPEREAIRQQVNTWLRSSTVFGAVIDLDTVLADPANPTRIRAEYDSGDHIHPNDTGSQAIAAAIPLWRI